MSKLKRLSYILFAALIITALVGCAGIPVFRNLKKTQLKVVALEVPGKGYGVLGMALPVNIRYLSSGHEIRIIFNHDLPLELNKPVFFIQNGAFSMVYPENEAKIPGSDVYSIDGKTIAIKPTVAFITPFRQGLNMICIPAGLKAANGAELKQDWYAYLHELALSPQKRALDVNPIALREKPTLVLPKASGDRKEIIYIRRDGTPLRTAPQESAKAKLTLYRAENGEVVEKAGDGWLKVAIYMPQDEEKWQNIVLEHDQDIYTSPLVVKLEGYLRQEEVAPVPPPNNPGRVEVRRSTLYEEGEDKPAVRVVLEPGGQGTLLFPEEAEPLTSRQISALEVAAVCEEWGMFPGENAMAVHTSQKQKGELPISSPEGHLPEFYWTQEEKEICTRFRSLYLNYIANAWKQLQISEPFRPLLPLVYKLRFTIPAAVQDAWLAWGAERKLDSLEWFAGCLAENLKADKKMKQDLLKWLLEAKEHGPEGFRSAVARLYNPYLPLWKTLDLLEQQEFYRKESELQVKPLQRLDPHTWLAREFRAASMFVLEWPQSEKPP